ncbi:MAG: hypothetical protein NZ610_01605 [Candidatus Bipolaricaulota bacterium]|nr:hypothetical protein [Candidatus Bipolaricaulota bacterium]MCS7274088.1 hypothetical protein [Candidatus Bipolaricaulota bacterium]MDW8110685.1 hypothetical protein [Candidatus Bipolaricaulota bacterium]MDW8328457.1 hypothetical protein [Candidatus Bipolaricaulota bacterium]
MRRLWGSIVGLVGLEKIALAQTNTAPYSPSGGEMIFIVLLTAIVFGFWVLYEWVRRRHPA